MLIRTLRLRYLPFLSLIALALFGITGCSGKPEHQSTPTVDPVADSLNAAATGVLSAFYMGDADTSALVQALNNLEEAYRIDSTNYLYSANAAQVSMALGKPDVAVENMEQAVSVQSSFAEGMIAIGLIRESQDRTEEARQWYEKAVLAYEQRINTDANPLDLTNHAFAIHLARGREAGLQAIEGVSAEIAGRAVTECMIRYGSQRDFQRLVVPDLIDSRGDVSPNNVRLDSCLVASAQ